MHAGPKRTGELSSEVATGCALLKGEQDPPLKPDSDYPDWLWRLLDPQLSASELQKAYESSEARGGLTMNQVQDLLFVVRMQMSTLCNSSPAASAPVPTKEQGGHQRRQRIYIQEITIGKGINTDFVLNCILPNPRLVHMSTMPRCISVCLLGCSGSFPPTLLTCFIRAQKIF